MKSELAEQHKVLERELANLDTILASDPDWKSLAALEGAREHLEGDDLRIIESRCRVLRTKLSDNRIFAARERIVEAIELIRAELDHNANVQDPSDAVTAQAAQERFPSVQCVIETHDSGASAVDLDRDQQRRDAAVRAQIEPATILARRHGGLTEQRKVTIYVKPPDSELASMRTENGPKDNLTQIIGIDAATAQRLHELGIRRFEQIAIWSSRDVASVRAALRLGNRIARENWIEQSAARVAQGKPVSSEDENTPESVDGALQVAQAAAAIFANLDNGAARADDPEAKSATLVVAPKSNAVDKRKAASADVVAKVEADTRQPAARVEKPADQLAQIRGIDEALAFRLSSKGVRTFSQIAAWCASDVSSTSIALRLGNKVTRESWIEQAALLADGISTVYSRHFELGEPLRAGAIVDWNKTVIPVRHHDTSRGHEHDVATASSQANVDDLDDRNADLLHNCDEAEQHAVSTVESKQVCDNEITNPDQGPVDAVDVRLTTRDDDEVLNIVDEIDFGYQNNSLRQKLDMLDTVEPKNVVEHKTYANRECANPTPEPKNRHDSLDEQGADGAFDDGLDFDEADVKILSVSLADDDGVASKTGESVGDGDEMFDAENYAGYHNHVHEASVSILPSEGASARVKKAEFDDIKGKPSARHNKNLSSGQVTSKGGLTRKLVRTLIGK